MSRLAMSARRTGVSRPPAVAGERGDRGAAAVPALAVVNQESRSRRRFIAASAGALLAALLASPRWARAASRNENAFNARSPESVFGALGLAAPTELAEGQGIRIHAPDVAENGANVPVEVSVSLPRVERVLLIAEKNLFPLLADAAFAPDAPIQVQPWLELKVKLGESSRLRVIVQADGRLYTTTRAVKVIVGGCLPG